MKKLISWLGLVWVAAMCLLCIVGAFLGAENAGVFFNTAPMKIAGVGLVVLLAIGAFFNLLHIRPRVFLIHLGCLFVLVSGLWGSETSQWGLHLVFVGYILLTIGLFGYFALEVKRQMEKGKNE